MDALLRTNAVTSTLGLLYAPNVHPEYVSSPVTHMLLGAIVSAGGGFLVSTLGAWNADWAFSTPPVLRSGAGWLGTLDVWGGALVGQYSVSTWHTNMNSFLNSKSLYLQRHNWSFSLLLILYLCFTSILIASAAA